MRELEFFQGPLTLEEPLQSVVLALVNVGMLGIVGCVSAMIFY